MLLDAGGFSHVSKHGINGRMAWGVDISVTALRDVEIDGNCGTSFSRFEK